MKFLLLLISYIFFGHFSLPKLYAIIPKSESHFRLSYSYAGLGSNFGSLQPYFRVVRGKYYYDNRQNSYYGEANEEAVPMCSGNFRQSSIDSVLKLVKTVDDTLIYATDINIMSGGIHYITIDYGTKTLEFKLHNASDPRAQKIVDIINSNLPKNQRKLTLF